MKRHFGFPIAVAATLHLALLFGFRSPARSTNDQPVKPPPTIEVNPNDVFIDPEPPSAEESSDAGGGSAADVPQGEETLRPPQPDDTVVRPESPHRNPQTITTTIPTVPFGPGPGSGETFGISSGPVSIGALDRIPRAIVQTGAVYPFEARKDGLSGEVLVAFTVNSQGEVRSPHVMRSSNRVFDEAALRAVAKWRFEPGRQHGRVVTFRMAVPVVFRLDEADER